jgi:hypothetical protein
VLIHKSTCAIRLGAPDICTCGAILDFALRFEARDAYTPALRQPEGRSGLEPRAQKQLSQLLERVFC